MLAVYAYFDAQRLLHKAESDEFNFTGTWVSTGTYFATTKDTVLASNSQYVCISDSVGLNPTVLENSLNWSPLVLVVAASGANSGQIISTTDADPNTAGIVPTDSTQGAIFYQDVAITLSNEWRWSITTQNWRQTQTP